VAGNQVVDNIKKRVADTFSPHVMTGLGAFGALFDIKAALAPYRSPVLVQSVDGVGTKLTVAKMMNRFDTIGHDIVANCCGDIVAMGARPLTFLDYVAHERLDVEIMDSIMNGMIDACIECGVSLVGGETAEMPGTYTTGEHDIVGCVTGVVERDNIINGSAIQAGDVIIGLSSSGLHTNGYSLARKILFDGAGLGVHSRVDGLDNSIGEELLKPHINYTRPVLALLDAGIHIKGIAHITGGGLIENIPRVLPKGMRAKICKGSWPIPPLFHLLEKIGKVEPREMYRTFNMGIGMVLICDPADAASILRQINAYRIGDIVR